MDEHKTSDFDWNIQITPDAGVPPPTTPAVIQQVAVPPSTQPTTVTTPPAQVNPTPPPDIRKESGTKNIVLILGVLLAIACLTIGVLLAMYFTPKNPEITAVPTPTTEPTAFPTRGRTLAPVATTSAFIDLQASVSAYISELGNIQLTDPRLGLPDITLPLGFSK